MLDPQRYQRAKSIFFDACEQSHDDREAFIDRACAGDADLLADVRRLLSHDDDPLTMINAGHMRDHLEKLADSSASDDGGGNGKADGNERLLPSRIGRYRILSRLGAGGMGMVYLAEQDNPRRQVALKVIASGQSSRQMLRRFEHEAQILGRLNHPGIAQVYEAGVHDSGQGAQPYFVMELVRGRPLLLHCEESNADRRARLELFIAICEAVQHAHQHGVIHRDLKPANILVEATDAAKTASVTPKILDFGVARLTDSDVQATTMHTAADQLIGTVAYMSPEQMSGKPEAIDTRSDVYALGVILFELLAGRLPHDVSGKTIPEMIRTVSESEPSTLSAINRSYRGDLETIVGKAMERDRARRYQSAGELAADVRRFLNDEPIQARPPSAMYQARKFARRNKALVVGAAAVLLALVGGIITTAWQARLAIAARDKQIALRKEADENAALANAEADKANAVNAFLRRMLASANPEFTQGRDVLVGEMLEVAARELDEGALSDQPDVQGQVYMTLGTTCQSIGRLDPAEKCFAQALRLARRGPDRHPEEEAAALIALGVMDSIHGNTAEAVRRTNEAMQLLRSAFGEADREDVVTCLANLADFALSEARQADAIRLLRESLAMEQRIKGNEDIEIAQKQARLAGILHDPAEAEPLVRKAMATFEKQHGDAHPSYVSALRTLADMATMRGSFDEAVGLYRRALDLGTQVYGRDHHRNLLALENYSFCLRLANRPVEFAEACDEMVRMTRQLYGRENMRIVETLIERADVRSVLGRAAESEADYREAAAMADRLNMRSDSRACAARLSVARLVAQRKGDLSEARALTQSVLELKDQFRGEQKWLVGQSLGLLGEIAYLEGDLEQAEQLCLQGFESLGASNLVRNQRYVVAHRLVEIYEAKDAAAPGAGHDQSLAKWRQRQDELAPLATTPAATTLPEALGSGD